RRLCNRGARRVPRSALSSLLRPAREGSPVPLPPPPGSRREAIRPIPAARAAAAALGEAVGAIDRLAGRGTEGAPRLATALRTDRREHLAGTGAGARGATAEPSAGLPSGSTGRTAARLVEEAALREEILLALREDERL